MRCRHSLHRCFSGCCRLVGFFLLLMPGHAWASCTPVMLVGGVAFGSYSIAVTVDTTINGSVILSCVLGTLPSLTVALSAGASGSFSQRTMIGTLSSNQLKYNLYTTAGLTTVWGDGTGSTAVQSYNSGGGLGSVQFTIYGDLPKYQSAPSGLYTDSVTVTLSY